MPFKFQQAENREDFGQQYAEDLGQQYVEDDQQQLIDINAEAEDLGQQQVNISQNDYNALLDSYAQKQESNHSAYNSHYHEEKESADEYEAEVCFYFIKYK